MSQYLKCVMFQKLDRLPSSDVSWGKNPTLLGSFGGATDLASKTLCVSSTPKMMGNVQHNVYIKPIN
jgi:hypothetical protein